MVEENRYKKIGLKIFILSKIYKEKEAYLIKGVYNVKIKLRSY